MKLKKMLLLALIVLVPFGLATASQATTIVTFTTSGGATATWTTNNDADMTVNLKVGVFTLTSVSFVQTLTEVPGIAAVYTAQLGGSGWKTTDNTQTLTVAVSSDRAASHVNLLTGTYDVSGTTTQALGITGISNNILVNGALVVGTSVGYPSTATYNGFQPFNTVGFSSTFQFSSTTGTFGPSLSLTAQVPEPATLLLLGFGLVGVGLFKIYRKKS